MSYTRFQFSLVLLFLNTYSIGIARYFWSSKCMFVQHIFYASIALLKTSFKIIRNVFNKSIERYVYMLKNSCMPNVDIDFKGLFFHSCTISVFICIFSYIVFFCTQLTIYLSILKMALWYCQPHFESNWDFLLAIYLSSFSPLFRFFHKMIF